MNDIMKIVKSFEDAGLVIKGVSETNKNEVKEQKGGLTGMLLGTLVASLLANLLTGKRIMRKGKGTIWVGQEIELGFLILSHPLTNFEMQSIIYMDINLMMFI